MEAAIFFAHDKKKNFDYSAVKDCKSTASENLELRFHRFPKLNEVKAWKIATKINKILSNTKVCSLHFKKSDYILPGKLILGV
ncbi:hypothetical protein ALC57_02066 [Trachymyrmex cornetzi]|uniref:THAP-type domain-containing protein n=1 Tax=Trachymyrmex cornetzi TaxID=471704 RepID=A0A151JP01_9HYME|nr:hypothetical protein ALC57_02066 [Trachymyrmex cornetzi]